MSWSRRIATLAAGALAGLVAAAFMLLIMAAGRFWLGISPLPESVPDRIAPTLSIKEFFDLFGKYGGYNGLKKFGIKTGIEAVVGAGIGHLDVLGAGDEVLRRLLQPAEHEQRVLAADAAPVGGPSEGRRADRVVVAAGVQPLGQLPHLVGGSLPAELALLALRVDGVEQRAYVEAGHALTLAATRLTRRSAARRRCSSWRRRAAPAHPCRRG